MTALETQLTEIVEKEQGQKIIPFLQKLTQEERKSLIPCLSRLEEYYNKFVQLEERTYGTRATSGQHHIIDLAALVIFPLKEFRKHEWGINTAHLNEPHGIFPRGWTVILLKVKVRSSEASTIWTTRY